MLNYYQPYLLPFLGNKRYTLPNGVKHFYYHSMEDALWEFTRKKGIAKGSLFLIPDFYCGDVLQNISRQGFRYKLWKMDRHFQTNVDSFINLIKRYEPQVVVIFHPAGITSNLMNDTQWINHLPKDSYIIEDAVHRLINPSNIKFTHKRHVIMDSLRKDSPLPGSFIYGSEENLSYKQSPFRLSRYFVSSTFLYILFRLILYIGSLLNLSVVTDFAHEKVLKMHDDIIGDSWDSYPGFPLVPILHQFLNFEKIEHIKQHQVTLYKKNMQSVYQNPNKQNIFYEISIPKSDFKNLHVYPVGINLPAVKTKKLVAYLHKNNISVWVKFPECEWSTKNACLFLPLGFHVSDSEIIYTVNKLESFISSSL